MPPCAKCQELSPWRYGLFHDRLTRGWVCEVTPSDIPAEDAIGKARYYWGDDPIGALKTALRDVDPGYLFGSVPAGHDEICLEVLG